MFVVILEVCRCTEQEGLDGAALQGALGWPNVPRVTLGGWTGGRVQHFERLEIQRERGLDQILYHLCNKNRNLSQLPSLRTRPALLSHPNTRAVPQHLRSAFPTHALLFYSTKVPSPHPLLLTPNSTAAAPQSSP